MTIQEIFETPTIATLEETILDIHHEVERRGYKHCDSHIEAINNLLECRQHELYRMFVMDEEYKRLLGEFNEALKAELTNMRLRTIKAYESALGPNSDEEIEVEGVCFLGYKYSTIHPIQTIRAKKIWALLNGTMTEDLNPMYALFHDGVSFSCRHHESVESVNQLLYLSEEEDNWNFEGMDMEMTKDMLIIHPIHSLLTHASFSMFDFLWVRDFNMEITIHIDSETHHIPQEEVDLDWEKFDYSSF